MDQKIGELAVAAVLRGCFKKPTRISRSPSDCTRKVMTLRARRRKARSEWAPYVKCLSRVA